MYKILFIDEQQEDVDQFLDYVEKANPKEPVEVITEWPSESLEEMISTVFSLDPDAVVTDFMLNDYKESIVYNVPYNGVQLVEELLSIREGFPCFVMTSFDDTAIKESEDVNLVYIKDILHNPEKEAKAKATFLERVQRQIDHYRVSIVNADTELQRLLDLRSKGEATMEDEAEIIKLDHFLEAAIDKKSSIPADYKTLSNTRRLEEILSKVDKLLEISTNEQ